MEALVSERGCDRVLVDAQRRVVDAVVIILRPVEHHDRAFKGILVAQAAAL